MQVHHKPTKILLLGRSGSGKSTYETRYVLASKCDHIFIYDHKLEFQVRCGIEPCYSVDDLSKALEEGRRFISYSYLQDYPGDSTAGFEFFCEWVYEVAKALQVKCLFVADEINRFTSTQEMGWEFKQLIEDGRLQGLDFIGTSHAANQISNRLRMQLTEVVALNCRDRRPLEFLDDLGFDIDEIQKLQTGEFVTLMLETGVFTRGKLFHTPERPENKTDDVEEKTCEEETPPPTDDPPPSPSQ